MQNKDVRADQLYNYSILMWGGYTAPCIPLEQIPFKTPEENWYPTSLKELKNIINSSHYHFIFVLSWIFWCTVNGSVESKFNTWLMPIHAFRYMPYHNERGPLIHFFTIFQNIMKSTKLLDHFLKIPVRLHRGQHLKYRNSVPRRYREGINRITWFMLTKAQHKSSLFLKQNI